MLTDDQLRTGFRKMAERHAPPVSNIAIVKSVDQDAATCVLIDEDGQEFLDVRLRPVLNGKVSYLAIPKIGTHVLAVRVEDDEDWMVMACDEFDRVLFRVGETTFELTDKIKLEAGGQNFGSLIGALIQAITEMVFVTPTGNTTALVNVATFETIKEQFETLFA